MEGIKAYSMFSAGIGLILAGAALKDQQNGLAIGFLIYGVVGLILLMISKN